MSYDTELQQAVLAEFHWEPSVNAAHIGVTASSGVVTLTGHVENYAEKLAAETAAGRVKGVKAVAEEIEVQLPFDRKRGDDDIAGAAVSRLAWNVFVPRDAIKIKVEKGWVSLTGQVDWHFQKEAAGDDIRSLFGVVGVSNLVTIKVKVNERDLSRDITHALHRTWFDPQTINVSAQGGKIRLSGTVHTPHERHVAATTAWSAPGATAVENDIAVV